MISRIWIVALSTFTFLANGSPTSPPPKTGRDPSQDYYIKSRTVNASSPMNNLYLSLGNSQGFAFWSGRTAFTIAFLPTVGRDTAIAYMNGTYQGFDVGTAGLPGATYSLGSSYFQGPDPSVPSTADIFQDGTSNQGPIEVSLKNGALLGWGERQWLICGQHDISPTTPPTLEIPNSGPFLDACELTDLVKEPLTK